MSMDVFGYLLHCHKYVIVCRQLMRAPRTLASNRHTFKAQLDPGVPVIDPLFLSAKHVGSVLEIKAMNDLE